MFTKATKKFLSKPKTKLAFQDNYTLDIGEEGKNYADESLPLPSASTSEGSPRGDMDESNVVTGYRGNSWVFENKLGVAEDLRYLSHMPELCDVTFLVGETREPICAVRAILAARSRIFHKLLYSAARGTPRKKNVSTTDKLGKRVSQMIRRSSIDLGEDYSALSGPRTIVIEEFDPSVFHQLIQYCHTGCVTLKPKIVLGLMNASDHYGLDELRRACMTYLQNCVNIDTVCLLLRSAEKYIQYKSTKSLVQKALEFVDINAESVLRLPAFTALPNHVARLILSRDELQADELTKFQAALAWSRAYMEKHPSSKLRDVMTPFIDSISFHLIPATTLMQSVKPTGAVPDQKIMTALAYQADPSSIEPGSIVTTPARLRLSMLSLNVHDSPTPTDRLSRTDNSSSSIKSATSYASLNTSRSSGIDKLPLDNEPDNEPDNPELGNRNLDLDGDFDPETCHNNNNRSSEYSENGHTANRGDDDEEEEEEEEDNSDERHDHVDLMFTQDRCFSPPCLSDTNTSCSMSICSDWTDTSSSAGGSFGRADQKESNFKLLVTE
ncbi:serine-enriched protein [Strongylocentrotus purpuratus]|uniref:BTB domain-containing protein n=1 Tax=Strongylocentrotus purpuratus TaxID=7668 RepID=A0A7M7GGC5_STRPU|nr:serine-enriched protein [Strongylocentrotus purpuratus]|eukprot:XP_003725284.1 PREDICTED: serine-enriched protein isoform X3 [Strongylocentrotus purpuratus]